MQRVKNTQKLVEIHYGFFICSLNLTRNFSSTLYIARAVLLSCIQTSRFFNESTGTAGQGQKAFLVLAMVAFSHSISGNARTSTFLMFVSLIHFKPSGE